MFETHRLNMLAIEDEELALVALKNDLKSFGKLSITTHPKAARALIESQPFDVAFVDLNLEGRMEGFALAQELKAKGTYVIIASGYGEKSNLKKGFELSKVNDFIIKPLNPEKINRAMDKFLRFKNSHALLKKIKKQLNTTSPIMDSCAQIIMNCHAGTTPIFLFGPTGSGKQLVAEIIHELNLLPKEKLFHLNCANLPETMIESLLFGHERGAFTGADNKRVGYLEMANGGTLFLDEVATMSRAMQDKIITAVELKRFRRLGSNVELTSNFRLIAATSSDIQEDIRRGLFRSDLFFRLNGTHITIPALKARIDDLENIINSFQATYAPTQVLYLSEHVLEKLKAYHWPGNIRELKNMVISWLDQGKSFVDLHDLPEQIFKTKTENLSFVTDQQIEQIKEMGMKSFITHLRDETIIRVFWLNGGNYRKTGSQLQINTSQIYKALGKEEKIHEPDLIS